MGGQIKSTNLKEEMKSHLGSEIPDSNISCLTDSDKKNGMRCKITYSIHLTTERSGTLPVCLGG
jgi:hypothetical protein